MIRKEKNPNSWYFLAEIKKFCLMIINIYFFTFTLIRSFLYFYFLYISILCFETPSSISFYSVYASFYHICYIYRFLYDIFYTQLTHSLQISQCFVRGSISLLTQLTDRLILLHTELVMLYQGELSSHRV